MQVRLAVVLLLALFAAGSPAAAQVKVLKGIIKDIHSDERIPFASVHFLKAGNGKLADSSGAFIFRLDRWQQDTLEITYVGYQDYRFLIEPDKITGDTINLVVNM